MREDDSLENLELNVPTFREIFRMMPDARWRHIANWIFSTIACLRRIRRSIARLEAHVLSEISLETIRIDHDMAFYRLPSVLRVDFGIANPQAKLFRLEESKYMLFCASKHVYVRTERLKDVLVEKRDIFKNHYRELVQQLGFPSEDWTFNVENPYQEFESLYE